MDWGAALVRRNAALIQETAMTQGFGHVDA